MRSQCITTFLHLYCVFWAFVQVSPLWRREKCTLNTITLPHITSPLLPLSSKWACIRPVLMPMTTTTAISVCLGRGRQHWTRRMSSLSQPHLTKKKKKKKKNSLAVWAATFFNTLAAQSMESVSGGAAAAERAEAADGNLKDLTSGGHSTATPSYTFFKGQKILRTMKLFTWSGGWCGWCYMTLLHSR